MSGSARKPFAAGAGAISAHSVVSAFGAEVLLIAVVDQRVEVGDAFGDHVAAASAVAAVRAAELDIFLAPEADAAVAAATGANICTGLIEELHG